MNEKGISSIMEEAKKQGKEITNEEANPAAALSDEDLTNISGGVLEMSAPKSSEKDPSDDIKLGVVIK